MLISEGDIIMSTIFKLYINQMDINESYVYTPVKFKYIDKYVDSVNIKFCLNRFDVYEETDKKCPIMCMKKAYNDVNNSACYKDIVQLHENFISDYFNNLYAFELLYFTKLKYNISYEEILRIEIDDMREKFERVIKDLIYLMKRELIIKNPEKHLSWECVSIYLDIGRWNKRDGNL